MTVSEKVAYLKGLMEGLELDKNTKEGKILNAVVDVLQDIALSIEDLEDEAEVTNDFLDELDHDLGDLEEFVYDCEDDDFDEDDLDDFDEDDEDLDDDEDDDDDDTFFFEVECPSCGDKIYLDDSIDPSDVICPNCHEHFDIEFEGCCDCDSCENCGSCGETAECEE